MGVHCGRSLWAFTVGVHCGRSLWASDHVEKEISQKHSVLVVKVANAWRGKVDFVLYFTGFGERHGANGGTDIRIKAYGLSLAALRMRMWKCGCPFCSQGTTCSSGSTTETFQEIPGKAQGPQIRKIRNGGPVGIHMGPHVKFVPIQIGSTPNQ